MKNAYNVFALCYNRLAKSVRAALACVWVNCFKAAEHRFEKTKKYYFCNENGEKCNESKCYTITREISIKFEGKIFQRFNMIVPKGIYKLRIN